MLVKFWDLDTRHCFKTIVSHRSEVNDLLLLNEDTRLITGCHDIELKVFELIFKDDENENEDSEVTQKNLKKLKINEKNEDEDEMEDDSDSSISILDCKLIGTIVRESKDPLTQLCVDSTHTIFSSHSANEKHVELYKINTMDDIKKRLAKKLKKQKRKLAANENGTNETNGIADDLVGIEQTVNDEFTRVCLLKTKHKIKYVDLKCEFDNSKKNKKDDNEESNTLLECKIACLLNNNQIEVYLLELNKNINDIQQPEIVYSISLPGHRTDVRTICFSSDSTAFATASGDSMKVWNRISLNCIRTFACDYALSSLFLSDDNHILIGTKVIDFNFFIN